VTLTDSGPLLAILDVRDQHHSRGVQMAASLGPGPMITTWPCFTEAMYLLHRAGGFRFQAALWDLYADGHVILHDLEPRQIDRMAALMAQYRDTPMDLADVSLVALADPARCARCSRSIGTSGPTAWRMAPRWSRSPHAHDESRLELGT
jgi:predicted nucleic acid-binding protein